MTIFDKAVAEIEATPRQFKVLPSGETVSYREYNQGQPHMMVMLPGYICDDAIFSVLAVLPEFRDHHIVAVNPRGWNGSSMNTPLMSHEKNADEVMELLKLLNIKKAMCTGYSTGGGIAFYMAQKYPETISAAFLLHSIPLNGFHFFDEGGKPISAEVCSENFAAPWHGDVGIDTYIEQLMAFSTNQAGFPPKTHAIYSYLLDAVKMPGKREAMAANMTFNVTPIKTPYAEPSDALSNLKSKIIVIHSKKDNCVPGDVVEQVTKLAIAENWAPKGMLSFYESGEGHMVVLDDPPAIAAVYRTAFEEQVLHEVKSMDVNITNLEADTEIHITSQ